jgi:CRP/FNR family cyclic AMP-dependent transcriptional regulator
VANQPRAVILAQDWVDRPAVTRMRNKLDCRAFVGKYESGTISKFTNNEIVYRQGGAAHSVHYIIQGTVRVTIVSATGREAVIKLNREGDFFGEGGLYGNRLRTSTAICQGDCEIASFKGEEILRAMRDGNSEFFHTFLEFLIRRNDELKMDLIDHWFNSSEKRLAKILLMLKEHGLQSLPDGAGLKINQEMLAMMVGTTRSRINKFLIKFRKLGYVECGDGIIVHGSLNRILSLERT